MVVPIVFEQRTHLLNIVSCFAMNPHDFYRAENLIRETINELDLNLRGLTVLTEVGSNHFLFTPIIAALAEARKVYAWTRDSVHGSASEIIHECESLAEKLGLDDRIEFAANERPSAHVAQANIITNSGFIRPLDRVLLSSATGNNAVIPLMYESWELRDTDIDREYCRANGIKLGGTWENHPRLRVFDYCGQLAVKMIHEAELEVFQNKIIVWSQDDFGTVVSDALYKSDARAVLMTTDVDIVYRETDTDALFLCDYFESRPFFGGSGVFDLERLLSANPTLKIIHLYGDVDFTILHNHDVPVFPEKRGYPHVMSLTLAYLGLAPVLKLQVGGLKVGECLAKNIKDPICQEICEN